MARILVIDDSPLVLAAMRDALERAGFEVETELSGNVGIERCEAFCPDVVITDLEMPEISGIEVIQGIYRHSPSTPVLILTEHADVPLVVQAMREGAFGYLRKGIPDDTLVEEINSAVKHREVLEQNRKLLEVARQYQAKLERMVEEKTAKVLELQRMAAMGTALAGVVHEVNNPLAVIIGNIELLLEGLDEIPKDAEVPQFREVVPRNRQTLKDMAQAAGRIERLVLELRHISHPRSGRGQCDLSHALEQVELLCRPQLAGKAELVREVDAGISRIGLSEEAFVSVVSNPVVNACHAVEPGEGRIVLEIRKRPDGWADLLVRDNGSGIAKEHLPHVFEPFFTTKAAGHGTGLGLFLVYQIITAAGGEVRIESEVGKGTTVLMKLPLAPETAAPAAPPAR